MKLDKCILFVHHGLRLKSTRSTLYYYILLLTYVEDQQVYSFKIELFYLIWSRDATFNPFIFRYIFKKRFFNVFAIQGDAILNVVCSKLATYGMKRLHLEMFWYVYAKFKIL